MRTRNYIRGPVKNLPAGFNINNITESPISDVQLTKNAQIPQSINIVLPAGEFEISLICDGEIWFVADDTSYKPSAISDVTESNIRNQPIIGSLILLVTKKERITQLISDNSFLGEGIPLLFRYEKVRLTWPFFNTLSTIEEISFRKGSSRVNGGTNNSNPTSDWFELLAIEFVKGTVRVNTLNDQTNPDNDFAEKHMPIVYMGTLNVSASIPSSDPIYSMIEQWNEPYDSVFLSSAPVNVKLELNELNSINDRWYNPRHISHSIVPLKVFFQQLSDVAWAKTADTFKRWSSSFEFTAKRISITRPEIPGQAAFYSIQRIFPIYKTILKNKATSAETKVLLPINGIIYLDIESGEYEVEVMFFWSTSNPADPSFKLSLKHPSKNYINIPQNTLGKTDAGAPDPGSLFILQNDIFADNKIYAHLLSFDSERIWKYFKDVKTTTGFRHTISTELKQKAEIDWGFDKVSGIQINDWTIPLTKESYKELYGLIFISAGRHSLKPEFLHSVIMGEGGLQSSFALPYDRSRKQNSSFQNLGLDLIVYRLGINRNPRPLPDIELTENLVSLNYVDPHFLTKINTSTDIVNETRLSDEVAGTGTSITLESLIMNWELAVEFVAAEINIRRKTAEALAASKGIALRSEEAKDYLTYLRIMARETTLATEHLIDQETFDNKEFKPWNEARNCFMWDKKTCPRFYDRRRFESLRRLGVTEWFELSQSYR